MAYLKVYEWEHATWPEFQTVHIDRRRQFILIRKLARHFKVDEPLLGACKRRGANAKSNKTGAAGAYMMGPTNAAVIKLGNVTVLGTLVHEFAHHLDHRRWGGNGHRRTFKRELKRAYTFAKRYLVKPTTT